LLEEGSGIGRSWVGVVGLIRVRGPNILPRFIKVQAKDAPRTRMEVCVAHLA